MLIKNLEDCQNYTTTTVALVTSHLDGRHNIMSAEWSIRASIEPYLVAVFVGYERETYSFIKNSGEFALNYCSSDLGFLAHVCGNYSFKNVDKFSKFNIPYLEGVKTKCRIIKGSIMSVECKVINEYHAGDHAIFIGSVQEGYFDDEKSPLVFYGGKFFNVGNRVKYD